MGLAGRSESSPHWLTDGGRMGHCVREADWGGTALGRLEGWRPELRTVVNFCLDSDRPAAVLWGEDLTFLPNDRYLRFYADDDPGILGANYREHAPVEWEKLASAVERALSGRGTAVEDLRFFLEEGDGKQERFFRFAFSPIRDENGVIAGVYHSTQDITQECLTARRASWLSRVGDEADAVNTVDDACLVLKTILPEAGADLPYFVLYLREPDSTRMQRVISLGINDEGLVPCDLDLAEPALACEPFARAARDCETVEVAGLRERYAGASAGPFPESPDRGLIIPVTAPGVACPLALILAGVSPRRELDEIYRTFFYLLRDAVANLLSRARAYTEEIRRRQASEALRDSEARYRAIVEQQRELVCQFRRDGTILFANHAYARAFGMAPEEVEGLNFWQFVAEEDHDSINQLLDTLSPNNFEVRTENVLKTPHGKRWFLWANTVLQFDDHGHALELQSTGTDITDRKNMESSLRESEAKFRHLAETVPTLVWIALERGEISYVNSRWTEYTGQTEEEAQGYGWLAVVHPDDMEGTQLALQNAIATGEAFEGEVRYRRHDGQYFWHHSKAVAIYNEDREITAWYGASLNIHPQKLAEQALRDSENHFRVLADIAPAMLWLTDVVGDCFFLSRGWLEYTGQTEEEVLGRGWMDAIHPADRVRTATDYDIARERGTEFAIDYRVRRSDGQYRWVLDTGRPRRNEQGEVYGYVGSVIDVHERKQAEDMLRDSEQRFRTLADNISQLAWMADAECWIFWYNQRWYDYTGTTLEEAQGWGWTRVIHVDQIESVMAKMHSHWQSGEPWEDTFLMRRHDGSYRWFLSRATPIRDESGRITRWFGTNTDVTDQRNAEEALKEADKRKDEFLATLAHELRNPLAPLRNGLEIMRMAAHDPQSVQNARAVMDRQLEHMVRLIDDLLDLSRISRGKITLHKRRVSIDEVIHQAVETSRPAIEQAAHELTVSVPPEPLYVEADSTRLAQVFSNLLNNAAKFTDRGGHIWLTVERRDGEIISSVRDNGVGIARPMLPRVFDMFTQVDPTLERTHGGLGIGLSLVKGLVEMHGGTVEAESDGPGLGSEFIVCLSAAQGDDEEDRAPGSLEGDSSQRRRILVVDDNHDSADSMATMMELMGNETRTAHDGLEALGVAAAFRPDVILLDIGMPKLNGYDVARKIREHEWGRDMMLVALTGWGQEEDRRRSKEAGFDYHLVKPVELAAVQQVLGASGFAGKEGPDQE